MLEATRSWSLDHPEIDNGTPFAFEPVFIADEELRPVVVTVIKATYSFNLQGDVSLADEQVPVNLAGEPATDAPVSSYRVRARDRAVQAGDRHRPDRSCAIRLAAARRRSMWASKSGLFKRSPGCSAIVTGYGPTRSPDVENRRTRTGAT